MTLSVALCTYNGEEYICSQIESILNQTTPIDEIVICDDLSNDRTVEKIKILQKTHPKIIKLYLNKKRLGTVRNVERAISLVKGDLIFLSDQDDIWIDTKVQEMSSFLLENIKCKLLFSDAYLINEKGVFINSFLWEKWGFNEEKRKQWKSNSNAFRDLVNNNNKITGATICFHHSIKEKIIPIKIPLGYWHDAWLGIHASAINGLMYIEKPLINYRIHANQQVGLSKNVSSSNKLNPNSNFIKKSEFYKTLFNFYPIKMCSFLLWKYIWNFYRIIKSIKKKNV